MITLLSTRTGARPSIDTNDEGERIRVMVEEYEDAFAFHDSLDEDQLTPMCQSGQVSDLTCQPGSTCDFATGAGMFGAGGRGAEGAAAGADPQLGGHRRRGHRRRGANRERSKSGRTWIGWSGATGGMGPGAPGSAPEQ